jgi:quercetin dioxygenase-like cupin family protein
MNEDRLDLTPEVGPTLRRLDELIEGVLREEIDEAVASAREMLEGTNEPFGWHFLDLGSAELPSGIRSGGVFVLPGGSAPPAHRHPNSTQHMRVLSGDAVAVLRSEETTEDPTRSGIGAEHPWLVIPRDVVHGFELSPDHDLVVLSFHTVPQEELLEVGSTGARTYTT